MEVGKEVIIRDKDADIYSQVANTRTPTSDEDKAEWLKARIEERIDAHVGVKMNALQIIVNVNNHKQRGDLLKISEESVKELYYILWAIVPGDDELSLRQARRLLEMLDWPEEIKEDVRAGHIPKSVAREVVTIKEPEVRRAVVETAKEKEWGARQVSAASQAVRAVETSKEKEQVVVALKGGIEPESVKRVTDIKKPEVRSRALEELEEVAKDKKKGETYVVEVAEEEDEDKAEWLKARIEERVSPTGGRQFNALQIVKNAKDRKYKGTPSNLDATNQKELNYIIWAIMPGDDISLRQAERLLDMLEWPKDVQEEVKKGDMAPSVAAEVARIKEPKARKQVIETAKRRIGVIISARQSN